MDFLREDEDILYLLHSKKKKKSTVKVLHNDTIMHFLLQYLSRFQRYPPKSVQHQNLLLQVVDTQWLIFSLKIAIVDS